MKHEDFNKDIIISIEGLGFVLYSAGNVEHIPEGTDFLKTSFWRPKDVAGHIQKGDITGFGTGSPGTFTIKLRMGKPDSDTDKNYPSAISLGLEVKGGLVSIIDLYWLMEWNNDVPSEQQFCLDDGFYRLVVLTKKPESGIWGDKQEIYIFFEKQSEMPQLTWEGVPDLLWWYEKAVS